MNYRCNYCGNVYLKEREQCAGCGARDFSAQQKEDVLWEKSVLPSGGYTAGSMGPFGSLNDSSFVIWDDTFFVAY